MDSNSFEETIQRTRIMYTFIVALVILIIVFMLGMAASFHLQVEILAKRHTSVTVDRTTTIIHP